MDGTNGVSDLIEWLVATFGVLIATLVISELLLLFIDKILRPLVSKTRTTLDDRLIDAIRTPIRLLGLIIGTYFAWVALSAGYLVFGRNANFWLGTSLIFWAGAVVSNLANAIIYWYYREVSAETKRKSKIGISDDIIPMLARMVKVAVYAVTLTIILERLGVEMTPIITALGIGGLAVALAVKDTLSNFFAGIYLLSDKPIKRGDFIALDDENSVIKGFVEEIGWRMTRLRTRGNYTYYIPNEKLTQSNLVNFSRGRENNWKGASLAVGVSYGSDVKKVKSVLLEAVGKVQRRDSRLSPSFEPTVRLDELGDSALVFKLFYQVNNHFESEAVGSEIREQVVEDLKRHGIEIPFNTHTVYLKKKETD